MASLHILLPELLYGVNPVPEDLEHCPAEFGEGATEMLWYQRWCL